MSNDIKEFNEKTKKLYEKAITEKINNLLCKPTKHIKLYNVRISPNPDGCVHYITNEKEMKPYVVEFNIEVYNQSTYQFGYYDFLGCNPLKERPADVASKIAEDFLNKTFTGGYLNDISTKWGKSIKIAKYLQNSLHEDFVKIIENAQKKLNLIIKTKDNGDLVFVSQMMKNENQTDKGTER